MAFQLDHGFSVAALISSSLLLWLCYALSLRYQRGVRSIPGPIIASFTDLWRLLAVHKGDFEITLKALHDKHGDLIRVGPNCVSIGDPREVKQIYSITRLYRKVLLA